MRLNLVTYHLIFAITGLVFCGLNSVINIVFYNIQSKVKHNECNTVFLKTIFQMMLGSWLTWTILCAAGHFVVSFEQVDESNKRLNYIAHHITSILFYVRTFWVSWLGSEEISSECSVSSTRPASWSAGSPSLSCILDKGENKSPKRIDPPKSKYCPGREL